MAERSDGSLNGSNGIEPLGTKQVYRGRSLSTVRYFFKESDRSAISLTDLVLNEYSKITERRELVVERQLLVPFIVIPDKHKSNGREE